MAKLGAFVNVSSIRGKLGGQVFTKGRSGQTLRLRVKGQNPRSTAQTSVRSKMAASSRAAKALSSANVTNWKNYSAGITKHNAVSGAAYNSSWINAFNSLAIDYLLMTPAGTIPSTPPASPYTGDTITITAAGSSGTITYTGSAVQGASQKSFLYYQKLKSANRTPSPKGYKVGTIAAIPTTPFQVAIGGLSAGTYAVGYKFGLTTTGQTSGFVALGTVTVT